MSKMGFLSCQSARQFYGGQEKEKKFYLLSNVIASVAAVRSAFRLFLIVRNEGGE